MATVKILGSSTGLGIANNVSSATMVYCVNTDTGEQTITVANTVGPENGGGIAGSLVLEAGQSIVIVKEPTDTVVSVAAVKATKVSRY